MSKLRDLLEKSFQNENITEKELHYKDIIIYRLEKEIKQEIITEEAEQVIQAEEKRRLIGKIGLIKDTFWTVVIIGILVGVTGNQVTELVSFGKYGLPIGWTIALIAFLILIMYIYFWIGYLKQATAEITTFKEKNG